MYSSLPSSIPSKRPPTSPPVTVLLFKRELISFRFYSTLPTAFTPCHISHTHIYLLIFFSFSFRGSILLSLVPTVLIGDVNAVLGYFRIGNVSLDYWFM